MKKIKIYEKLNFKKSFCLLLIVFLIGIYLCNNLFFKKSLIDDYYTYINDDILEKEEIKDGEYGWSRFSLAQDKVLEDVEVIVKDLINSNSNVDINTFYNNIVDVNSRNKVGIDPLKKYISLIDSSKNINEFINNAIVVENELFIDIFSLSTVASDFNDTSKNIVYFYPITFGFGSSSDFYVNEDYSRYHALVKQYQIKLLKLYGYDKKKARSVSKMLDEFYVNIAKESKSSEDLSDVDSLYNIVDKNGLQKIYSNIDINSYLEKMGIANQEYFSLVDISNYKAMNSYLVEENLYLLKEYVKVKILENYASFDSLEYANIVNELNDKMMGINGESDLEEEAIDLVSSYFSSEVDRIYLENNFSNADKVFIESMVEDILNYYEDNINDIAWMNSSTKEKAILKLKKMKINVGGNYSKSYAYNLRSFTSGGSLIENILYINKVLSDDLLNNLNTNKIENIISPTVVNAYYNPLDNSINFPASLKELYSSSDDYYKVLGSMGMIIAHEVTHAFDNNGSKFDEFGNRVNWWSESDYDEFKKLQLEISDYYSNYEVIDGLFVDGVMTVGENIADLGALNCIVGLAKEKKASEEEMKVLFSSYASLWASEYIDMYQKLLLLSDTHSPDKIRVNAVLSSIDEFYEVYDISKNDLMYVEKENRVGIW